MDTKNAIALTFNHLRIYQFNIPIIGLTFETITVILLTQYELC